MSKPWGNIGAWAADSERAEEEEREATAAAESQSFPSLKEAVTVKPKKGKKMTLSEFNMGGFNSSGVEKLTPAEMLRLPTGPKERSAEEMQSSRYGGGGFSSFDRGSRRPERDGDGSWGAGRRSYGGFDDERRGPPSSRVSVLVVEVVGLGEGPGLMGWIIGCLGRSLFRLLLLLLPDLLVILVFAILVATPIGGRGVKWSLTVRGQGWCWIRGRVMVL